jgi:hypothetical protein
MSIRAERAALPFVLCADDYGLTPGVSRGIRELIEAGALTATGCMTVSPFWPEEAPAVAALQHKADIGLHFTLTDHRPLGAMPGLAPEGRFPPLPALLKRALLRRLDKAEIAAELRRQLAAFQAHFGRQPDFIDGHHHVHQLPIVRDALLEVAGVEFRSRPLWLRSCWEPPAETMRRGVDAFRALIITQLGRPLDRLTRRAGIRTNHGFRGIYDFEGDYPALFSRFIERPEAGMLVMCHPGHADSVLAELDPVTGSRERELAFFLSPAFRAVLDRRNLALARLSTP